MINWQKYETQFVQLETGTTKKLTLTNWQEGACFDISGLKFDVVEEDGEPVEKVFTTTSRQVIQALKPVIMKAEEQGRAAITVSILKLGEGSSTLYEVKNVESNLSS
ncbi:hypothetical protein ACFL6S_13240 [Candidatus Poribacteria bacterium]